MASALAEQHRKAQIGIRAAALRDLLKIWPAFRISDIAGTWGALEEAALLLVKTRGQTSGSVARTFYGRLREEAGARGVATPKVATVSDDEIIKGLRFVGPANAGLQLSKGRAIEQVARATLVNVSGEVARHVNNFGRRSLTESLLADQKRNRTRVGVQRVTGASPCEWCASQASEIYSPTQDFPAHRLCACFPTSVYF